MLKVYWRLIFKPCWLQIVVITVSIFVTSVLDVVSIGMIVPVVAMLTEPQSTSYTWAMRLVEGVVATAGLSSSRLAVVTFGLALLVALVALKNAVLLLQTLLVQRLSATVELSFNVKMFDRFMHACYAELARRGRGAILKDVSEASSAVSGSVGNAAAMLNAVVLLLLGVGLLIYLSGWAVPIVVLPMLLVYRYVGPSLHERSRQLGNDLYEIRAAHSVAMVDLVDGIRVIKSHAAEDMATGRIEAILREHLPHYVTSRLLPAVPSALFEVVSTLLVAALVLLMVGMPSLGLTVPSLAAMLILIRRLLPAVTGLNESFINLSRWLRVMESTDEVLNTMEVERGGAVAMAAGPLSCVEMRDVSFRYAERDGVRVLRNVNLALHRGQVTALVGQTGAGKSTVADLLVRLYDAENGRILVDGVDVRDLDLAAWRRRIGYVGQDPYLFNTSVRHNITLWDDSVSAADVDRAIRIAQLEDLLNGLPDQDRTVVGDRGLKLSGGQRQRVAIARALVHRPDILIFDEATSALDSLTEQEVHTVIGTLRETTTMLVIAHRLATVQDADIVVVLHEGQIVEQGPPRDLVQARGPFWRLYERDVLQGVLPK